MAAFGGPGNEMLPASWAQRPSADATSPPVGRREVARALEFAAAGSDLHALLFAIDQATQVGVSPSAVARAEKRKASLEDQAQNQHLKRARCEALSALESAMGAGSVDMLDTAIGQAERAGLAGEALDRARAERQVLAADFRRQQARSVALAAVRVARQSMDIPGLLQAIRGAAEAGANPDLIRRDALGLRDSEPDQRRGMAACLLHFAIEGSSIEVLDLTISWARIDSVNDEEVVLACKRRAELEEASRQQKDLTEAANGLSAAWRETNPEVLEEAIERARATGVSAEMVRLAEKRLQALRKAALRQGSTGGTPLGEEATEEEIAERQRLCGEAATALKTAMVRSNAEALRAAIEQAEQAGVRREVVAPARRKLARLAKASEPGS